MKIYIFFILFLISSFCFSQSIYEDYSENEKENIFYDNFTKKSYSWETGTIANKYSMNKFYGYYELKSLGEEAVGSSFNTENIFTIDQNRNFEIEISIKYIDGFSNGALGLWWGVDNNLNGNLYAFCNDGAFIITNNRNKMLTLDTYDVYSVVANVRT